MAWGLSHRRRKEITVAGHGRESEGVIVAMKRGNARGAKDPCRTNVFIRRKEIRLDTRPTTEKVGRLNWDQELAEPEVKSGVKLPMNADFRGRLTCLFHTQLPPQPRLFSPVFLAFEGRDMGAN